MVQTFNPTKKFIKFIFVVIVLITCPRLPTCKVIHRNICNYSWVSTCIPTRTYYCTRTYWTQLCFILVIWLIDMFKNRASSSKEGLKVRAWGWKKETCKKMVLKLIKNRLTRKHAKHAQCVLKKLQTHFHGCVYYEKVSKV
jgi:energy-coupling factor transporter transmembrane protein EcfT